LVRLYEIKTIEGEASITIRKQKQIFLFEFELELYFDAVKTTDPDTKCKGKVKVHEFNQDDDELVLDVTQEKDEPFVLEVKKILNNEMNELLLKTVMSLGKAMRARDVDENKLKKDQMDRENAKKAVEEAKATTGAAKDKIFEDAKVREAEMKVQEKKKADEGLVPMKVAEKPAVVVEGSGSVWNNNSYHWEQKSVETWSQDTLKATLGSFYFKYENATLKIKEVKEVKGDSSVSIRKGKKITTYDYNIKLVWKLDMGDDTNTKVIGTIEGEYEFPEMSNDIIDDGEEWEINARVTKDDSSLLQTMNQVIKKFAPDALRKAIMEKYVAELLKK
jgi:activator of HSP90 ATPase